MNSKMDRRDKSRLDLRLSCRVVTGDSISENSDNTTENISRNGLLLRWTRPTPVPEAGSPIRVEVELPSDGLVSPRMIRCESTVVRVLPADNGQSHVALKVNSMCFVDDPGRTWVPPATPVQELVN
jgi:hypothetical protein